MNNLFEALGEVPDPRMERTRHHSLEDVLSIVLLAVICGADSFNDIEDFGGAREEWLQTFLKLENGIPSHDTFNRVLQALDVRAFQEKVISWLSEAIGLQSGHIIPIDGKTARRSGGSKGRKALHSVSAWVAGLNISLGQVRCDDHSNEITAIPVLLDMIDLKGNVVTIDAMGTQKEIARKIVDGGGDYVLALKENQKKLFEDVQEYFNDQQEHTYRRCRRARTVDGNHGRIEERQLYSAEAAEAGLLQQSTWKKLNTIVMIETTVEWQKQTTTTRRYYISSLPHNDPKRLLECVRGHWSIENSLHWILDVVFNEDRSRVRTKNADQNFAFIRKFVVSLLKNNALKRSIHRKRFLASISQEYLLEIIRSI